MGLSDLAFRCFVADHKPKPEDVFRRGGLTRYVTLLREHGGRRVVAAFNRLEFPDRHRQGCRPDQVAWFALLSVAAASMREQMGGWGRSKRSSRTQRRAAAAGVRRMATRLREMIEGGAVGEDQVVEFIQAGEAATVALTARSIPSLVERFATAIEVRAEALGAASNPGFWDRAREAEGRLVRHVKEKAGKPMASDVCVVLRATLSFWEEWEKEIGDRSYDPHSLLVGLGRRSATAGRAKSHAGRRKTH